MSLHDSVRWLVTYDIADPRRLARLFKFLKKHGTPVQYSVFLVEASPVKMSSYVVQMAAIINANADDVRAYKLPDNLWQVTLGASILPADILPGGGLLI